MRKFEIDTLYKESLIKAVIEANKEILNYLENNLTIKDFEYTNIIGFGGDDSLNIDLIFENIFIKRLSSFGNILSEECGFIDNQSKYTFVIDPLDGSNNFYSTLPYFGTSVALKKGDETVAGFVANLSSQTLVYRVYEEDIKYFCLKIQKEFLPIKNSKSKVAIFERGYKYPDICKIIDSYNFKFRILGATALSLANARDYDFVLFKGELREFDICAALYICKDLYILENENTIFITKYKEKFDIFKEIIN